MRRSPCRSRLLRSQPVPLRPLRSLPPLASSQQRLLRRSGLHWKLRRCWLQVRLRLRRLPMRACLRRLPLLKLWAAARYVRRSQLQVRRTK